MYNVYIIQAVPKGHTPHRLQQKKQLSIKQKIYYADLKKESAYILNAQICTYSFSSKAMRIALWLVLIICALILVDGQANTFEISFDI